MTTRISALITCGPADDVAIAGADLAAGTDVRPARSSCDDTDVPRGQKIAVRAVPAGAPVHPRQ